MADNEYPPPSPDTFREFGGAGGWPSPQPPPAGYPTQPPVGPGGGPGYWQPGTMPPPGQGSYPGAPGQTPGFVPNPPPPSKTSPFLIMALGGLALLVILVPLVLYALSRAPAPTTRTPQATATPGGTTPAPTGTPSSSGSAFKPDGTAPTTRQCNTVVVIPCYSPQEMQQAFSLNALYAQGYDGKGQTIVIIAAGNTDHVEKDLQAFDKAWGLPDPPSFKIVQPFGPPTPYKCSDFNDLDGLQIETALDVEWSHAMAPGASIVVVVGPNKELKYFPVPKNAPSCGLYDLEDPVAYALDKKLGNIISISYGGSELGTRTDTAVDKTNEQKEYDAAHEIFKRAASMGVTVMASSGDNGATNPNDYVNHNLFWDKPNVSWPASDPYVLAIGGTSLTIQDENGVYGSETTWNNNGGSTGGGLSALYGEPAYQKNVPDQGMFQGKRGLPDLAFPADVNYLLYETSDFGTIDVSKWPHWNLIGGTSASSPCWAGLIAIADQMSAQAGGGPLGYIQPGLYSLKGQAFHDITKGNNNFQRVAGYAAVTGYDLVTGWGTPIADQLLPALIQAVQTVGNTP